MKKPICGFCGNDVFAEFSGSGSGNIPLASQSLMGEPLCYSVCVKCGTVNRIYVKDPEKLFKTRNTGKWI